MERKNAVDIEEIVTHHMWKKMEDLPEIKERKKNSVKQYCPADI